ncbi:helix-turn-helix domain-containing protein [Cellulomonas cellasea]|uniref:MarR family transcripitonal regulator n=2 Tax=Cellulomonas cellasea TaxID=43670 RepID=A0A0A0BBR6_9CELL|nr:helix-turn-helix domain-containing protein [Cellulomonas cellasea]KGM03517.1 MarR family transcripitonal regulator [Cellulomonas cellasea DSM 20118]GEA87148.1 MarR family transcriptional regulator [Cellulomonas cellasea]
MPGGRLTQQERQQIALGLADDLAYAEIARRIDRPTSTVTREVMRNGGPTAYRADLAHRATERRARRQRQAPSRVAATAARGLGADAEAVREYEETFTTLFMQSGLPRIAAGVLTCLYTSDAGSLTAAELVQRLEVSPASISKAVTLLESQGLVLRERAEGRRERYVADADVWYQSMVAAARSHAEVAATARQGVRLLGRDSQAGIRLENMARFMEFVGESILRASEQARDILSSGGGPRSDAVASGRVR